MMRNSKIYVAGHKGLVGSAILRCLQEKGYKNIVYRTSGELDLCRQQDTEDFFEKEKIEYVFLAAAKVGGILANNTYKAEFIYNNIMIAANIVQASYKYGVKKFLNLGSSCIYPKHSLQPMKEEYLLTGNLEPTNEPYAVAKISAIKLCRYYNEQYGMDFISGMPSNLYGVGDNFNLETAHVIPSMMRKFHLSELLREENYDLLKKNIVKYPLGFGLDIKIDVNDERSLKTNLENIGVTKDKVTLWGTGEVFREFLYVDDLADACVFLMASFNYKHLGELINIGSGEDSTLKQLAETIKEVVGFSGRIIWDSSKPNGVPRKVLDISKIKNLGWNPKTDLRKGLETTYKWFKE